MDVRKPAVADQFYPADRESCLAQIHECLAAGSCAQPLPEHLWAGIVPHAGWMFSGPLAAMVFSAVKQQRRTVDTFVVLGAAHGYFGAEPALDGHRAWQTPLGEVEVDEALRQSLAGRGAAVVDAAAHRREHSIEVQVPFIKHLFPEARIVAVVVPATEAAMALGEALAEELLASDAGIVCIGSTDLTHYGPRYGFTPRGIGAEALHWASSVNDRQFIDLAVGMRPERLLANAIENGNACGPGAAVAAVTMARRMGVSQGVLLAHTSSNDIMFRRMGTTSRDSVGYAAIVF